MAADFAALENRIKAMESKCMAVLKWGFVVAVNATTGTARVQIEDEQGLVSYDLRVLQRRTHKDQHQELPDIGEHVACLFVGQRLVQGIVLGAFYSGKDPSPGRQPHVWYRKFEDGAVLEYDRETHKLLAKVPGMVEVTASGEIVVTSSTKITMTAPEIELNGNLTSRSGDGGARFVSSGMFRIDADDVTFNEECE